LKTTHKLLSLGCYKWRICRTFWIYDVF